ncbi:hypothetical protein [Anaerofustis stercorihominis]|uniref:hypothetical protein n=1 Tax=Anaerofustis stercorihominis TaxID=214853 RepID=UPI00267200CE|nr:hypothetical protein [Anaerofustis stercorihominis]
MANVITKTYGEIRGVDFSREARNVKENRSPDMVNMWKDYESDSECIVTREGYDLLLDVSDLIDGEKADKEVYGIHVFTGGGDTKALVHAGSYLFLWEDFPSAPQNLNSIETLATGMGKVRSESFMYNDKLYINDGLTYYRYDGSKLIEVSNLGSINEKMLSINGTTVKSDNDLDVPFVPITSISRLPMGGGDTYQNVNLLTPWRKNQFVGDGKSKTYALDTTELSYDDLSYIRVWINDTYIDVKNGTSLTYSFIADGQTAVTTETKTFKITSINKDTGEITFNEPPPMPMTKGQDNVVIMFYKYISGYKERINECRMNKVFDNRVFFSGNATYKNGLFHSELNDPEYISDLGYYQDGADNEAITSIVVGGSVLWVFKDGREGGNNLFYHIPTTTNLTVTNFAGKTETKQLKTYPVKQGKSSSGCFGCGINFLDDVCFLSKEGMFGLQYSDLQNDIYSMDFVCLRSRTVNPKLIAESEYLNASVDIYKGYLCILINGHMYLADSRCTYSNNKGYEYEWYYFKDIRVKTDNVIHNGVYLKTFDKKLYFGTDNGEICVFSKGTFKDNEEEMDNYITLKSDNFDYMNRLKTTSKRGGIAKFKVMGNSSVNVWVKTNKDREFKYITTYKNSGFNFGDFSFSTLSFLIDDEKNYQVVKTKQKKFNEIQFRFSGEGEDRKESKPFGFYSLTIEGFEGSYIKR